MRHYHGTPIGKKGSEDVSAKFLTGRHVLIPYPRQDDLDVAMEVARSVIFDNGAFTVWKQGGTLDVDGYVAWCDQWHRHPRFEWALIPDVIDGTEAANDALLDAWPRHIQGVPVYHLHEKLERLQRLASEWPIVALGSSGAWSDPGSTGWWSRMAAVMDAICDNEGRPLCKLHGLRMLNPAIFTRLPMYSADSTNAGRNGGNTDKWRGPYSPLKIWQRMAVVADRVEAQQSSAVWVRPHSQLLFFGPNYAMEI
jgi:hypothetical protein